MIATEPFPDISSTELGMPQPDRFWGSLSLQQPHLATHPGTFHQGKHLLNTFTKDHYNTEAESASTTRPPVVYRSTRRPETLGSTGNHSHFPGFSIHIIRRSPDLNPVFSSFTSEIWKIQDNSDVQVFCVLTFFSLLLSFALL